MADGGKVIIKIDGDDSGFEKVSKGLSKTAGLALKGVAVGAAAVSTAIGKIGFDAIKAYGDYEQLVGGVETLFKDSANSVVENANKAFQTAGMSANEYMQNITSFSAVMINSFGGDTQKAAELADQTVKDMSDNANKMGTDLNTVVLTYQSLARGNFAMLDNLKIGYGGTKTELERLLKDAEKLSGVKYDVSNFADIAQAIHVVQTEMGIAGTTAEEASTTIQGSLGMLKASWENLLIGLTNPDADLGTLLDNMVTSATTVLDNLIPQITALLPNISNALETLAPIIMQVISELIPQLLPVVVDGITTLSNAIIGALPMITQALISNLPMIIDAGIQIILALVQGVTQMLPDLIPVAVDAVLTITENLINNIDMLIDAAIELILALADGLIMALPILIEKAPIIIQKFYDAILRNYPKMFEAAGQLIGKLVAGIVMNFPQLVKSAFDIVMTIKNAIITYFTKTLPECGKHLVTGLWKGITSNFSWLVDNLKKWCNDVTDKIKSFFGIHSPSRVMRDEVGVMISKGISVGIDEGKKYVIDSISGLLEDTRTEVQKVMDEMNKTLLDSEIKYNKESERLKDSKSETDKKYLERLKDDADKERKIYDALQRDIENSKKNIVSYFKEIAENAFDSIEEVQKAQNDMLNKLKNFTGLYESKVVAIANGQELKVDTLTDQKVRKGYMKRYENLLMSIKDRKGVASGFFKELRDMSVEDGMKVAEMLAQMDDTAFSEYMKNWQDAEDTAKSISKMLFKDEAEEAAIEVTEVFAKTAKEFFSIGEENARQFGEGFIAKLSDMMDSFKSSISMSISEIMPTPSYAGGGSNITYANTYTFAPSPNESIHTQLQAVKNADTLAKMRGDY